MEYKARSLISAAAIFIGLLIPLRFPNYFWQITVAISLISALLSFWVFAEKPNIQRVKEDWFTILFLGTFVLSSGVFAYLMPHPIIQALILGATGLGLYFCYLASSRMKRGYTPSLLIKNIVSLAVILAVFFSISDIAKWVTVFNVRSVEIFSIILAFLAVFIMSEYLFEVHGVEKSVLLSLAVSFSITQITWLSSYWLITYPQSERISQLGVPIPAIFASIYFYLFWGLSHHHLEESLTKKILWEYVIIASVFAMIVFLTAQWMPQ